MGAGQTSLGKKAGQLKLEVVLQALADPIRLEIVRKLDEAGQKACGTFDIGIPKSSLSYHFTILRRGGVISSENQGVKLINRLERDSLDSAFPGLLDSVLSAARRH